MHACGATSAALIDFNPSSGPRIPTTCLRGHGDYRMKLRAPVRTRPATSACILSHAYVRYLINLSIYPAGYLLPEFRTSSRTSGALGTSHPRRSGKGVMRDIDFLPGSSMFSADPPLEDHPGKHEACARVGVCARVHVRARWLRVNGITARIPLHGG